MDACLTDARVVAVINWKQANGVRMRRRLHDGETVAVGSAEIADIRLDAADAAPHHCVIWAADGQLFVRDCYSEAGTFVDGARITEARASLHGRVSVGETELRLTDPAGNAWDSSAFQLPSQPAPKPPQQAEEWHDRSPELQRQLDEAQLEIRMLRDQLLERPVEEVVGAPDPFQQEMIEMLQAEIVQLQQDLARRDGEAGPGALRVEETDDDLPTREEVEHLTSRLEELLDELGERDQQIGVLEKMLHASEEANAAEREGQAQLNAWVDEIEGKFSQREQEWSVRLEKLNHTIEELTAERNKAEVALAASHKDARVDGLKKLLEEQRDELTRMQSLLEEAAQRERDLQSELEQQKVQTRAEAVQLSQERAALARSRHELEAAMQDVQRPVRAAPRRDARQDGLRELCKQKEIVDPCQLSLSQRLKNLWNRLDG